MSIKRCVHCETSQERLTPVRLLYCAAEYWKGMSVLRKVKIAHSMKIRFLLAILISSGLPANASFAQEVGPGQKPAAARTHWRNLTVDDYFRIKDVEDAQISPDGKWVAYVATTHDVKDDKDKKRIWMTAVTGGDAIALTNEDANSSRPRWSLDGKYLGFLSERGSEKKQLWLLPRGGGEAEQLTDTIQDVNAFEWSPAETG